MKSKNNLTLSSDALNKLAAEDFKKAVTTLEFDKIRGIVASFACTESGKAKAERLMPSVSLELIRTWQSETTQARFYLETKGVPPFGSVPDVSGHVEMAKKGASLSAKALLGIADVLSAGLALDTYLSLAEKAPLLEEYRARLSRNRYLRDRITSAIPAEDLIADTASTKLADIRREIKLATGRIREVLQKYVSGPGSRYLQEPIITQRNGRYVVPVKSECRGDVKGLVHDTSASGSTVFIEPAGVVEANNRLRMLYADEKAEIERILYELSAECDRFSADILTDLHTLTSLDVLFAKADFSLSYACAEPVFNTSHRVNLIGARHPLLNRDTVVPISVSLGKSFTTLVITGPNTGGKTVTLKTIGLLALMAQSGLHIPASSGSTLPVFDSVFADIGDEQSIEQSLSTFSAHMVGIVDILRKFTPHSLILFDELGAGTDPIEGAALAQSILEKITAVGTLCAATTHYAELKAYALDAPGVTNASCEFDVQTLRPTYRLTIGLPGRSNAFAIASRLGISGEIIKASKAKIDNGTRSFEGLIGKVERERIELEKQKEETEKKQKRAEELLAEAEALRNDFNTRIRKENEQAAQKAAELLERARSSADYVFAQLQEIQKHKDAEDFKKQLEQTRDNVRKSLGMVEKAMPAGQKIESPYVPPRDYVVGDTVRMADLGKTGVIQLIDGETVTVAIGAAKIKTKKKNLRLADPESASEKTGSTRTPRKTIEVGSELDVRGETGDDAVFRVDKFLDDAVLGSLPTVRVIHGKGTGALRKAIWDYLKRDKRVESYRPGAFGEGDAGVTVITLK